MLEVAIIPQLYIMYRYESTIHPLYVCVVVKVKSVLIGMKVFVSFVYFLV